jgi:prolyl oligopeptidase
VLDLRTDTDESIAWQAARTAKAVPALRAVPGYELLGESVLRHLDAGTRWTPVKAGGRWFQLATSGQDADLPALTVRDSIDGPLRVLVDPSEHQTSTEHRVSMPWFVPSPDGTVVVYAITVEGTEVMDVFLVDVATGEPLPDKVPWSVFLAPSWLPDSSGFWCMVREITATTMTMPIRRFLLGQPVSDWSAPLPETLMFARPEVSQDGHYVAIATGNTEMRVDALITKDLQVIPFLEGVPGAFRGTIADESFIALTDNGAPRGRIVRIPLDSSTDPGTWTELVAESDDVLADVALIRGRLVVASLRQCSSALDVIDLTSGERTAVPLPGTGGIGAQAERVAYPMLPAFVRGDDEISFIYSDPATGPAVYRYLLDEQRLECLQEPALSLPGITVSYITATSGDGVEVPAHVIHRADLDLDQPHPTFLWAYGGFHAADLPAFLNGHAAWVQAGGIHVMAHPRGSSAFGTEWWKAGRRERKQNTFNDFYAVAEKLIALGWTTTDQLAIYGGSNGGLLTAVALTQRPELFGAVVSDVPATDLLNMHQNPLLYAICRDEYGDALIPDELPWLQAYDPIANARPANYPATLVVAGANDPRCPANQARLLVDAVSRTQTGDAPILLRVHADQGHGGSGLHDSASRLTEILGFCAKHTGLDLTTLSQP